MYFTGQYSGLAAVEDGTASEYRIVDSSLPVV
jgi:hypothetical protein